MATRSGAGFSQPDFFFARATLPRASKSSTSLSEPRQISEKIVDDVWNPIYTSHDEKVNLAIIFNHYQYKPKPPKEDPGQRNGTNEDASCINNTLTALNFTVKRYDDLKFNEIRQIVKKVSALDKSIVNSVIFIVMTHGCSGNILWAQDLPYSVNYLIHPFGEATNSKMAGVPKLFFIQACRGDKVDKGFSEADRSETKVTIPTMADILVMFSTCKGYKAFREESGSWFIQTLAQELLEHSEVSLIEILTRVNYQISYQCVISTKEDLNNGKQVSEFTSSLTKVFKFGRMKEVSYKKKRRIMNIFKELPA